MMAATDRTLLARWIACRDAEAFNEILARHADLVYGVCRRVVRNHADAEDLAQACFLKLARAGSPPRSSLLGWLHAVATRSAVDFLRARARRQERERVFAEARARERALAPGLQEIQEHVDECIARLPAELREVIVAHFLERRTQEAVAAALGVSRQTVSHRLQKGIGRLRLLLGRRGVASSAAALASWLGSSPVEAAPAALLAALGRLALAGPSITTEASAALVLIARIGGFIMAKKLLISAVAAAALLLLAALVAIRPPPDPAPGVASGAGALGSPAARVPAAAPETAAGLRPARERTGTAEAGEAAAAPRSALTARTPLTGRVLDVEGRPVGGAKVVAAAGPAGRLEKLQEAASDGAGGFRLELAGREGVAVYGFKDGVGLGAAAGEAAALEITLEPLCEVGGRLYDRDSGEGIAGLTVRLSRFSSPGVSPEAAQLHADAWTLFPELHGKSGDAVSGEDGRYLFQRVSPVRCRFEFDPDSSEYVLPGYRRDDPTPELQLEPGERRSGVDFALERGGSIAGRVFGPDGRALPGAQVRLVPSYATPRRRALGCDPEGSYRFIGLAPKATYVVQATHAGLPPGESPAVALPAAEAVEGVDIRLSFGHAVRGRFIDDLGAPVPGVQVALSKRPESGRGKLEQGSTVTAADGSFSFAPVAPGAHVVRPFSPMHVADQEFPFTLPGDGDLSGLEFVLRRKAAGFISGRVVDASGEPVAGMQVSAVLGLKPVSQTLTGEDGAFRLDALGDAGAYKIVAYSSDYWSASAPDVPLHSTDVTLVVLRRGRIHGRVVEAETGEPLTHFEVRAVFIRTLPGGGENRFHLKWTPFDSATGEFLIERAEPVECELQVRAGGHAGAKSPRFVVPPGGAAEGIVIKLRRGVLLRGTVQDAGTGKPLPGVHVRAHQHDRFEPWLLQEDKAWYAERGVWMLEMSKADGSFEFGGLEPGESVHLVAWKQGYGTVVRSGLEARPGGEGLSLSLAQAGALLISARFRPRPDGWYEFYAFHREEKPWRSAWYASAKAEGPGAVEISGLPAGSYRLAVYAVKRGGGRAGHQLLGDQRLRVSPGERREVALDLDEFAGQFSSIAGVVTGRADPSRVLLELVSVEDPEEFYGSGPVPPDTDGRFRFTGLPAGAYVIVARSGATGAGAEARLPVQLGARELRDVEVAFE